MIETLKTLVTDDEEGMCLAIQRALHHYVARFSEVDIEAHFEVAYYGSAEETLEAIQEDLPDLLLLDYKLPGLSGLDLLQRLNQEQIPLLVIVITAYGSLGTAVQATRLGAYDFMTKPFTPEELRATVRKAAHHIILQRQARKLAAEKRAVRFEFISVLAHELKSPLNAVEGYIDNLQSGLVKEPQTIAHVLNRCQQRITGMRKLIFDLLDLTHIESGTRPRELKTQVLYDVADQALQLVAQEAQSRNIQTTLECDKALEMVADLSDLTIVFNNLLSNAVKYNREGGQVTVTIRQQKSSLLIVVEDTGIGLAPEEASRLFQDFVRIKNAKTRHIPGSGLGLATVKKIVDLYHGRIEVKSQIDQGSIFCIELPYSTEQGEINHGD